MWAKQEEGLFHCFSWADRYPLERFTGKRRPSTLNGHLRRQISKPQMSLLCLNFYCQAWIHITFSNQFKLEKAFKITESNCKPKKAKFNIKCLNAKSECILNTLGTQPCPFLGILFQVSWDILLASLDQMFQLCHLLNSCPPQTSWHSGDEGAEREKALLLWEHSSTIARRLVCHQPCFSQKCNVQLPTGQYEGS